LIYLASTVLVAGALIATITFQAGRILQGQIEKALEVEIQALTGVYAEMGLRGLVDAVERRSAQPGSNLYLVTSPQGEPISGNVVSVDPGVLDQASLRETAYERSDDVERTRRAIVSVFVLPANVRLLVGRDLIERDRLTESILQASTIAALVVLLVGLGGGWLVSRRVGRRIEAMSETSRSIMAGDLSRRLALDGSGDEFDRLADSVNAMLARIEALMRGLRDVSDDIAHDLKTPLTRLRARVERALTVEDGALDARDTLSRVLEETDGLLRTFDALLAIARLEGGAGEESFAPVDLAGLVRDMVELHEVAAEEAGTTLSVGTLEAVTISGQRDLLARAVANMIDNSIKYGVPTDGSVGRIDVAVRRDDSQAEIIVTDRGPGIPEADRARVLDRFTRLERSRSKPGSGLGLTLSAAIARLHKGEMRFEDATPGLRAILRLSC
jgi:signal transduction histidine kinase